MPTTRSPISTKRFRLDPKNAWAYAERGNLYKNKGDVDHALADLNESIRLDPAYALAHFSRGDLYRRKGDLARRHDRHERHDQARSQLCARLLHPRPALLHARQRSRRRWRTLRKAIKLDADDATAYFNRGVAYYVIGGRTADAEADFRKAAELNPKDAYAALWRDLAERRNNVAKPPARRLPESRHDGLARARDPPVPRRVQPRTNLCRGLRYRPADEGGADLRSQFL